jgi:hypothetical protein
VASYIFLVLPSGALGAKSEAKTESFPPPPDYGTSVIADLNISKAAIPKFNGYSTMNHLVSS